jgi:hypothetical protein
MAGDVILVVPNDKRREKAAALAARLTKVLDPAVVRVAALFRTACTSEQSNLGGT